MHSFFCVFSLISTHFFQVRILKVCEISSFHLNHNVLRLNIFSDYGTDVVPTIRSSNQSKRYYRLFLELLRLSHAASNVVIGVYRFWLSFKWIISKSCTTMLKLSRPVFDSLQRKNKPTLHKSVPSLVDSCLTIVLNRQNMLLKKSIFPHMLKLVMPSNMKKIHFFMPEVRFLGCKSSGKC